MFSAFGVDHGEIAKARFIKPRKPARGMPGSKKAPTRNQRATQGTGAPTNTQKVASAAHRAGEADISLKAIGRSAGGGIRGVGGFLEKRPGLTGTALIGGGGAAGYHFLSQKEPRKRTG